jgi:hypothetical protein
MNNRTTKFGELSNLAGLGQSSVGSTGQAGQNAANQIGNNLTGAATMSGASGIANANAWSGALNNGVNQWMNYSNMNNGYPGINGSVGQGLGSGSFGADMSGQMNGYQPYPTSGAINWGGG